MSGHVSVEPTALWWVQLLGWQSDSWEHPMVLLSAGRLDRSDSMWVWQSA
jgi:hypothetical protein